MLLLLATDAGSMKVSSEEAGQAVSAEELADELQKQCSIVSVAQTSHMIPGVTTAQLCATAAAMPPNVAISNAEQLRQLLSLLSKKNDRQLVVPDEFSKVLWPVFCYFYHNAILYIVNSNFDLYVSHRG